MADKAQNPTSAWTPVDESTSGWTAVDEPKSAAPEPATDWLSKLIGQKEQPAIESALQPLMHPKDAGVFDNVMTGMGNIAKGAGHMLTHPEELVTGAIESSPPAVFANDVRDAYKHIKSEPNSIDQFAEHPAESLEYSAGENLPLLLAGAGEGTLRGAGKLADISGVREAALGNPDEAAMRGLHVSPQSPKALRTLSAVGGARPFLQGVKGLEDLQARVPMAKQEIWAPMEETLNRVGGKEVPGPNGPTTLRDLENRRLEISAQLRALKSGGPEAMALAQQKGLTQAGLLQEEAAIKSALDPHLRSAGIDPEAIRKSFGQVSSIGGRVAGKTTLGETPIPTGFGRMTDIKLDNPRSWIGEPVRGVRDIFAGRPLWSTNPTDMNIREAFRAGGPKPNFTIPIAPAPRQLGRGPIFANAPESQSGGGETMPPEYSRTTRAQRTGRLLGSGPIELPGRITSEAPAYTPTSRAERMGLFLPEEASGKTLLGYQPEMSGGERVAALMHELRKSPQRALPRRASPFIMPPPQ